MTPNYLTIGMVLKNKSGISYTQDLQILSLYVVFKGIMMISRQVFRILYTLFTMVSSISMRRLKWMWLILSTIKILYLKRYMTPI